MTSLVEIRDWHAEELRKFVSKKANGCFPDSLKDWVEKQIFLHEEMIAFLNLRINEQNSISPFGYANPLTIRALALGIVKHLDVYQEDQAGLVPILVDRKRVWND